MLPNFVVQLGINGDPKVQQKWRKNIKDDPVVASNSRGTVTFAMAGKGTRTTQIFFNKIDNSRLDKENFAPFGEVIRLDHDLVYNDEVLHACLLRSVLLFSLQSSGMDIIDRIYAGYKENADQVRFCSLKRMTVF